MQPLSQNKIFSLPDLVNKVQFWKTESKIVVFTNGCFDILHAGHIDYLEKAKNLGHKLIVGLNTDASVKKNKGEDRPINNEFSRSSVLCGLSCVDALVFFDQETPHFLISQLEPDILVKGSDYQVDDIVGADLVSERGGKVMTIQLLEGYSTTRIIDKIKRTEL